MDNIIYCFDLVLRAYCWNFHSNIGLKTLCQIFGIITKVLLNQKYLNSVFSNFHMFCSYIKTFSLSVKEYMPNSIKKIQHSYEFVTIVDIFLSLFRKTCPKVYNPCKEQGKAVHLSKNITRGTKKSRENGLGLKLD